MMSDVAATPGEVPQKEERIVIRHRRRSWPARAGRWLLGLVVALLVLAGLVVVIAIALDQRRKNG